MKKAALSREDFLSALNKGKKCYLQKPRSWQKIWYWWEIDKKDPDERWFMNVYTSEKKGLNNFDKSSWITAKDLPHWLDMAERQGYKFYTDE